MTKKGFTLVELLAVIIIMTIILAVAVPAVTDLITSVKKKAHDAQVQMIIDAARKYVSYNNQYPSLNTERIVTLEELQDNQYIGRNIIDSKTGKEISPTTWIIVTNINDNYTYTYGYITRGLVLQYDGKYNTTLNSHNGNISTNKGTWTDLTGNGNDGTLTNFDYTSASGWIENGLKFDGIDDIVNLDVLALEGYTVEVVAMVTRSQYNGLLADATNLQHALALGAHASNALFYFGGGSSSNSVVSYGASLNLIKSIAYT
ncbi:MAG: prepilin-type N-terminal cleavage/methylation domain-containing protein, partial [Bacilli bacterium]